MFSTEKWNEEDGNALLAMMLLRNRLSLSCTRREEISMTEFVHEGRIRGDLSRSPTVTKKDLLVMIALNSQVNHRFFSCSLLISEVASKVEFHAPLLLKI